MAEFHTYETNADGNQQAVPNGWPRSTPGGFYGAVLRETMAACRRIHDDLCGRIRSTGSNGNYVVALSRGIDLARGCSFKFRANHENPAAGPTLSVGSSGQRPLTYADGSTIPAGAIKSGQLLDVAIDTDNNRWTTTLMPGGTTVVGGGTVTGDKLSLSGEAQGSVAIRAGSSWIASAAGTATQFFRGGPNPGFATVPGTARLLCTVGSGTSISSASGLTHTASVSRLSEGRYRITPSPAFPDSSYRVFLQAGSSEGGVRISMLDMSEKLPSSFVFRNYIYNSNAIDATYTDIAVFY